MSAVQGIELNRPHLNIRPSSQPPRGGSPRSGAPIMHDAANCKGGSRHACDDVVLDITMQLTMRGIPPLNMNF